MLSAIVIPGLMLVGYAQAAAEGSSFSSVCGSLGFSKDVVTSSCAFASNYYANPSTSNSRCNLASTKLCSSRAFLSSLRRTYQLPVIGSAYVGLTGRAATSTSSIEPLSDNEETATEKEQSTPASEPNERLVIIIGGTGFLGTEIRKQLQERGIEYIATTTPATFRKMSEKDKKFIPLDLTAENAQQDFYDIVSSAAVQGDGSSAKEVAIIAAMGTIGTKDDEKVNAALAEAIRGAHRVNVDNKKNNIDDVVKSFVMIGNTKRVRRLARKVAFLKGYAEGKDVAEATLTNLFGENACIIKPSFIYGGKEIGVNPPRIPTSLGGLASEILGLYPLQALADELPDALALPLAPPISVEVVASAAINVALGIVTGYTEELEGKEAIVMAGTVRQWKEKSRYENLVREEYLEMEEEGTEYISGKDSCSMDTIMEMSDERRWNMINNLKDKLLRRNGNENINDDNDLEIMEELECLRPQSMIPAEDPKLNGRWNFVLSKDDLGTQLIKELLPPDYHSIGSDDEKGLPKTTSSSSSSQPPWKLLLSTAYQLQGLYMRIHNEQSQVEIVLSSKLFFGQLPFEIVFSTSLLATNYDEETAGLLFLEKFEDVELRFGGPSETTGWKLPIPSNWQRFRHLEITFLDDEIVIARGSGGDPHVLIRAAAA